MAYTTIDKSGDYFNTVLNTGDNTSPKSITGVGFQPDLVWTKTRGNTNNHTLFDSVRGAGASKELSSDSTAGEGGVDTASYGYLSSFDSDGFTATSGSIGINYYNATGSNYVNWNWLGGGTASSNTDGSITSSVSANTTSGFSVVSYTGTGSVATVGHGLGTAPAMVIVKNRDATSTWITFHKSLPNTNAVFLNLTNASTSGGTGYWNNTSPTSSVFSIGNDGANNVSGNNHIAYCFAEKKGFSKFDSYTGNGNADGTFVYTGFKPAWVMIKQSNASGEGWFILDNKRETINPMGTLLIANSTDGDNTSQNPVLDFTSGGFKLRTTWGGVNGSGSTYIYMAFAEAPIVGSNNVPANAR